MGFCLMFSTGCNATGSLFANYRPIEQLKLVHTLGFDLHEDGLTLSICGGEQDGQGIVRLSATGRNITECLDKLQDFSGKEELYYAHTRYVLVGEDYAKQGLGDVMQYLESSNQLRSDLPLFIIKNSSAKHLMFSAGREESSINEIMEAVMRDCAKQGKAFPFTCGDIGSFSAEYGSALACALAVTNTKEADPDGGAQELTPLVSGYGIIRNGDLVGYLSEQASRGVNFLINETGTEPFTILFDGLPVSLRVTKTEPHLCPRFSKNGMIELTIELELEATLEETEQKAQPDPEHVAMTMESTVQQWMEEILMTMRNTETDFLGFGPRIAIAYPKMHTDSPIQWTQRMKTLPMHATVRCSVSGGENEPRR